MAKPLIGAQLYNVREFTQTFDGLKETMEKVAAIGYTTCQISGVGADIPASDIGMLAKDNGLTIACTHMAWSRFLNDLDSVIADHKAMGCVHPAIGSLPPEYRTFDSIKQFRDELYPIAEKLAAEGLDFSYHNHSHEFIRENGKTWLEMLYETCDADHLKAEIDTYWVQAGGGDPALWVEKMAGREPLLHLKDMIVTVDREQRFSPIGEGNLNWPRILGIAENSGVDYMLCEQDRCWDGMDPFDALAMSYRNLTSWGYK